MMRKLAQWLFGHKPDAAFGTKDETVVMRLNVLDRIAIRTQLRKLRPLVTGAGEAVFDRFDGELDAEHGLEGPVSIDRPTARMLTKLLGPAKAAPIESGDYLTEARTAIRRHGGQDPALRDYLLHRVDLLEAQPAAVAVYGRAMLGTLLLAAIELLQQHAAERYSQLAR